TARSVPPPAAGPRAGAVRGGGARSAARRRQGAGGGTGRVAGRRGGGGLVQPGNVCPRCPVAGRWRLPAGTDNPGRPVPVLVACRTGGGAAPRLKPGAL